MTANPTPSLFDETREQTEKRLDLVRRFTLAGFADTSLLERVPGNALMFLLPDDDETFVESELAIGLRLAERGEDVYFRHVKVTDLPD
jgi:hypothetical protein